MSLCILWGSLERVYTASCLVTSGGHATEKLGSDVKWTCQEGHRQISCSSEQGVRWGSKAGPGGRVWEAHKAFHNAAMGGMWKLGPWDLQIWSYHRFMRIKYRYVMLVLMVWKQKEWFLLGNDVPECSPWAASHALLGCVFRGRATGLCTWLSVHLCTWVCSVLLIRMPF